MRMPAVPESKKDQSQCPRKVKPQARTIAGCCEQVTCESNVNTYTSRRPGQESAPAGEKRTTLTVRLCWLKVARYSTLGLPKLGELDESPARSSEADPLPAAAGAFGALPVPPEVSSGGSGMASQIFYSAKKSRLNLRDLDISRFGL